MRTSFQMSVHCTVPCIAQVLHCKSWCIAQHRAAHTFSAAESLRIARPRALHENFLAKVSAWHNPLHCTSASPRPPVHRPPPVHRTSASLQKAARRPPPPQPLAPTPCTARPPCTPPAPSIAPPRTQGGGIRGAASGRGDGGAAGGEFWGAYGEGRGGQICVSCTFSLEGLLKSSGSCTELSSGFLPQPSAAPLLP